MRIARSTPQELPAKLAVRQLQPSVAHAKRRTGRSRRSGSPSRSGTDLRAEPATLERQDQREAADHALDNQAVREGHFEAELVDRQANKEDAEQPLIACSLSRFAPGDSAADVCVVGCGPAGLALAGELAAQGLSVALVGAAPPTPAHDLGELPGRDQPFVNNYGVWTDEYSDLGLEDTLNAKWEDAVCYFGEGREVRVGRSYGRVCRRRLRTRLLEQCAAHGVRFAAGEVRSIACEEGAAASEVTLQDGTVLKSRLVTLAAGAAAGKFMRFEPDAPTTASQTAYGVEAEVEGFDAAYDARSMLFMDFRRHHSGLWTGTGPRLRPGKHPAAGDGLWGTQAEVPSFLYAMPVGENRVFLEETCLVAKPALPFATLKRRLHRRMAAMGLKITKVHEEEWSYIPVGGPLPVGWQPVTAFGAAANLIHPATGYSIVRSLREAPQLAAAMARILRRQAPVAETSAAVWEALWPREKRRQAAFHVFGMELLATLDVAQTNAFFNTFFRLPDFFWRGFLSSSLSSAQLIAFALLTYTLAPLGIKWALMRHLLTSPAGGYLLRAYLGLGQTEPESRGADGKDASSTGVYITPAR